MTIRSRIRDVVEHRLFQQLMIVVIVTTMIALVFKTPRQDDGFLATVVMAGLGLSVAEVVLRIWAYGWRYFRDPWNVFDIAVITVACIPGATAVLALRFLRLLRVLRLVSSFPSLRRIAAGLLGALPGLFSIGVFIALIILVGGVIATNFFGAVAPQYFDDLGTSLFTLFQAMTGEGWPDVARVVMSEAPIAWIFFVIYIVTCTLGVLNVLIAVIVSGMEQATRYGDFDDEDISQARIDILEETLLREIRLLRAELTASRGQSGGDA